MVQVLPYVQTPLEQLTPYITQAAGHVGTAIRQHGINKSDQSILAQLQSQTQDGQVSPVNFYTQWGKLSEGARKKYEPFLQSHLRTQEAQAKEEIKTRGALNKEEAEKKVLQKEIGTGLDRLEELSSKYVGNYNIKNKLLGELPFTETAEKREELDKLGIWEADRVYTHFNKGVLNQAKWNDVKNQFAPSTKNTHAQNKARINALREIIGLPPGISSAKLDKIIDKEVDKIKKTEIKPIESYFD
jgi:hypothetical protein